MSHITNYNTLTQELIRAREIALPRFPEMEVEIYNVFELANELIMSLWAIDKQIEATDFNQAIKTGQRFMSLANRFVSLNPHIKLLFTSPDTPLSWRQSTTNNIVQAIESEARAYVTYFRSIVSHDFTDDLSPEEEGDLSSLRSQIRQRAAMDDKQDPIRWSNYRQPKQWLRLRDLAGLPHSVNIWAKLCRDYPEDIQRESTKSARISLKLAQSWGLDLSEFQM